MDNNHQIEDNRPFFHELSKDQYEALLSSGATWVDIVRGYQQPSWCSYPKALLGQMGCWSLTLPETRSLICPAFCNDCDCYIKSEKK